MHPPSMRLKCPSHQPRQRTGFLGTSVWNPGPDDSQRPLEGRVLPRGEDRVSSTMGSHLKIIHLVKRHAFWANVQFIDATPLPPLKFQFQNGADRVTLFVNPEPGKPEPAEGLVKSDLDLGVPEELFLYSTGAHRIDELRLGPTFLSVTPTK